MKKILITLYLAASMGPLPAQNTTGSSLTPVQQAAIETAVRKEMGDSRTPGASLAIIHDNRIAYEKAFGRSNILTGAMVNDSTMFQVASVTKIFTALALLTELQRSGISVQAPVGATIRGLSPGVSRLTFHQILTHTSGMIDFWPGPNDCQDIFTFFKTKGDSVLFAAPGEVFSYCNMSYGLAGLALEKLTGKPYTEAINDIIIKPLQLNHTTFDFYAVACNSFSAGHMQDRTNGAVTPFILDMSCPLVRAAGGLYSTVHDLERLVMCLMNDGTIDGRQIFDESVIKQMTGRYAANFTGSTFGFPDFPDNAYGYGMFTFNSGPLRFMGNIGIASQMTYLMYEPGKKFAIILLSNLSMDMLVDSFRKICEVVLGETLASPVPIEPDPVESRGVAGSYLLHALDPAGEATADILEKNGRLFIRLPGVNETELTRVRAWEYRFNSPDARFPIELVFQRDDTGKVRYMRYYWAAWEKVK